MCYLLIGLKLVLSSLVSAHLGCLVHDEMLTMRSHACKVEMWTNLALIVMSMTSVFGQRGSYSPHGFGYPPLPNRTTTNTPDGLGNRFGENDMTTQRLPLEALGDRDLVDRLSKLPIDNQPFWFINWQALEAQRKKPQVYPQRPSPFGESIASTNTGNGQNFNAGQNSLNSNAGNGDEQKISNLNTRFGNGQNATNSNMAFIIRAPNVPNSNTGLDNRHFSNSYVQSGNTHGSISEGERSTQINMTTN